MADSWRILKQWPELILDRLEDAGVAPAFSSGLGLAYLKDVLERMVTGHPASRQDDLLPWNWKPQTTVSH